MQNIILKSQKQIEAIYATHNLAHQIEATCATRILTNHIYAIYATPYFTIFKHQTDAIYATYNFEIKLR